MRLKLDIQLGTHQIFKCLRVRGRVLLHVHDPFLYLRNGSTAYAQIWYVVRRRSYTWPPQLGEGVGTHVRTCNPARIYISGMAGLIKLKLGMRLGDD